MTRHYGLQVLTLTALRLCRTVLLVTSLITAIRRSSNLFIYTDDQAA